MKILWPNYFFLSRGNHEFESINRSFGFEDELKRKFPNEANLLSMFSILFESMPLCYTINDKIFVVHGGLTDIPHLKLSQIESLNRFNPSPEEEHIKTQLLWSDPQEKFGISPSMRGVGVLFGPDVTEMFLQENKLNAIIRSHVWKTEGYELEHSGKVVTIFSAPYYCGEESKGAFINIRNDLKLNFVQFEASAETLLSSINRSGGGRPRF